MSTVTANAPGFFTGSGNVIAFSVDLFDICRVFRIENSSNIVSRLDGGDGKPTFNKISYSARKGQWSENRL